MRGGADPETSSERHDAAQGRGAETYSGLSSSHFNIDFYRNFNQNIPMRKGFVYIMSNKHRTIFYIGITSDIKRRVLEHKTGKGSVFTKKYNLFDLLYYEIIEGIQESIAREKQLKNWHRDWKINLIKANNPQMIDLAEKWYVKIDNQWSIASFSTP